MLRVSLVVAALAAGCYSPSYKDCAISCASNACPSDLACVAGMCRTNGATEACSAAGSDAGIDDDAPNDSSPDAAPYATGMWGSASMVNLGMSGNVDPSLTPDMLTMYFTRSGTIYTTSRMTTAMAWSTPVQISFTVAGAGIHDQTPNIQPDDLTILFSSDRAGGRGGFDLWIATRPTTTSVWNAPTLVPAVNGAFDDTDPYLSGDRLTLLFTSPRDSNMNDLFVATRTSPTGNWGSQAEILELNTTPYVEAHAALSPDELTIFYQSNMNGNLDLYTSQRTTPTGMFATAQPIAELRDPNNPNASEGDPWVSPDGHHIFFSSNRSGMNQIYEASR